MLFTIWLVLSDLDLDLEQRLNEYNHLNVYKLLRGVLIRTTAIPSTAEQTARQDFHISYNSNKPSSLLTSDVNPSWKATVKLKFHLRGFAVLLGQC